MLTLILAVGGRGTGGSRIARDRDGSFGIGGAGRDGAGARTRRRAPGPDRNDGAYAVRGLRAGRYDVRYIASGFAVAERRGLELSAPVVVDVRLVINAEAQVINVDDEANRVTRRCRGQRQRFDLARAGVGGA